jgi:CheY-like chemotaxis protein
MLERVTKIDLVLIDFAMRGMSGTEVARRVQAKRPAIPILFVTGFADRAALAGVSEAHIIGKPFIGSELSALVLWRR